MLVQDSLATATNPYLALSLSKETVRESYDG